MTEYKRFLLFDFPDYYPTGGLADVSGQYDSKEEALKEVEKRNSAYGFSDSAYVWDRITGETIWQKE